MQDFAWSPKAFDYNPDDKFKYINSYRSQNLRGWFSYVNTVYTWVYTRDIAGKIISTPIQNDETRFQNSETR